jgi:predicted phosphodiesterase
MFIQIVSDLHLEFPENREWLRRNPLIPKGDVLLIAGDTICDKYKKKAKSFYDKISKDFKQIISVPGNHEYYHGIIDYAYPFYKNKISENHIRLNNQSIVIDNVKFIVTTLWSKVPEEMKSAVHQGLNDYHLIFHKNLYNEKFNISVEDTNNYFEMSLTFLKSELIKPFTGKKVVMTHHLPSYNCISQNHLQNHLNSAYASNINSLILDNPDIDTWFCGHSHDLNLTCIGKTRIIRNPLGYVSMGEEKDFKRDFVIEL